MKIAPRRVPDGTTEITYATPAGDAAIPVKAGKGGTFAHPASAADITVLDGFGWSGDETPEPAPVADETTAEEG